MAAQAETSVQEAPIHRALGQGVDAYSTLLQRAGGEQLQAMMHPGEGRTVCAALYAAPPYDLQVPAMAVSRLSLNLTPARVTGGMAGDRSRSFDAQRYSLFMAPARAEMKWHKLAPSRHLTVYFRPQALAGEEGLASPLSRLDALHNLNVPGLRPLADQLVAELRLGGPHNPEAAECLARLLLIQVSRHLSKARAEPEMLGVKSLSRLKDYVMAHLDERILVADLARQVGLSVDRFTWAFKTESGQTPHQFVLSERLRQARHLLQNSALPIADVAHGCGFSSQQHLTSAVQRCSGVTPACHRQAMKPGARAQVRLPNRAAL